MIGVQIYEVYPCKAAFLLNYNLLLLYISPFRPFTLSPFRKFKLAATNYIKTFLDQKQINEEQYSFHKLSDTWRLSSPIRYEKVLKKKGKTVH